MRDPYSWRALGTLFLACSALLAGCSRDPLAPRADVLLITVDTLRADVLGCYGGPAGDTPAIDALAAEGLVFDRARCAIPITTPSLGTILTGRLPRNHGALGNAYDLGIEGPMMVERLSAAGYECAAFLPTFLADKRGFKEGFDVYEHPRLGEPVRTAEELVAEVSAWLDRREADGPPWFCWIHVIEPHAPYEPSPELERWALEEAGIADFVIPPALRDPKPISGPPLPVDAQRALEAIYRAEVVTTDRALAPLLERARGRSADDPQLTIFTADHGEMLAERHGYVGHTGWLYEEMLRVPLILHLSGGALPAGRTDFDASLHDLPTTVTATVGVEWSPADAAVDLFAAAEEHPPRIGVYETFGPEGRYDQQALLVDGMKLHRPVAQAPGWPRRGRPDFPRLYSLSEGLEDEDLAPGATETIDRLERLFAVWRAGQADPTRWVRPDVQGDQRAALEALGYLQSSPDEEPDAQAGGDGAEAGQRREDR